MAKRTVRVEREKRGFFGTVFKWLFIAFNVLMALWLFRYWSEIGGMMEDGSEAYRTGAAIGATMGTGMLLFFWAAGAVILGLLTLVTRGRTVMIEELDD